MREDIIGGLLVIATLISPVKALAAPPAPAASGANAPAVASRCTALASDWRSIEIDLAESRVSGMFDNSAPRANVRAADATANYAKASIILRLMELNRCTIPAHAPSDASFLLNALQCSNARGKATIDQIKAGLPECDKTKWEPGLK